MHDHDAPIELPPAEESIDRLRRSGWSCGETGWTDGRGRVVIQVDGRNGEKAIRAEGATAREAWWRAVEMAAACGMLRERPGVAPCRRAPVSPDGRDGGVGRIQGDVGGRLGVGKGLSGDR